MVPRVDERPCNFKAGVYHRGKLRDLFVQREMSSRDARQVQQVIQQIAHRLDLALDYLREQEILRTQLKDELGLNQMRVSLADTYLALGDFERALESLAATLPHWAKLDDAATEADAYGKLGLAYMSTGEYEEFLTSVAYRDLA